MLEHQAAKSKHLSEAGKPALRKHDATWTAQALAAVEQLFASVKAGMGFEHQFPHDRSQSSVGDTVVVDVQRDGFVVVVEIEFIVVLLGVVGFGGGVDEDVLDGVGVGVGEEVLDEIGGEPPLHG